MATPTSRLTPVFPHINVGSYTGSPIGTPPVHIFVRHTSVPEAYDSLSHHGNSHTPESCHSNVPSLHEDVDSQSAGPVVEESPDVGNTEEGLQSKSLCWNLTPTQIVTLVILVAGNVSASMFYSLLAPFFPTEAKKKGASLLEVGMIFGSFQLIQFVMAPIFGYYMTKFGSKYLFVAGNFLCSGCGILFGTLEWCPGGLVYVLMCFVVRSVEAVGAAAQNTATFAIGAHTFPNHISIIMGFLQASSCIGLMSGPPIGGLLYWKGGFHLPFMVTGALFMFFSVASFFFLPSPKKESRRSTGSTSSKLRLLRVPIVTIIGFLTLVAQATIGFVDVALAQHLTEVDKTMSTVYIGLIFLLPASLVVMTAPVFGLINDKNNKFGRPFMIFGTVTGGLGFLGLGPSPLLPFLPSASVKMIIVSLVVSALGWGSLIVAYQEYVTAAKRHGLPDGMETQGIISGINGAFNSLGALIGPTVGGVLYQQLGFPWSATIFGGIVLLAGFILVIYMICEAIWCPVSQLEAMGNSSEPDTMPILSDQE